MQMKNIIIVVAALAAGVAAGWFAGGVGGRVVPNAPMAAAWDKPPCQQRGPMQPHGPMLRGRSARL